LSWYWNVAKRRKHNDSETDIDGVRIRPVLGLWRLPDSPGLRTEKAGAEFQTHASSRDTETSTKDKWGSAASGFAFRCQARVWNGRLHHPDDDRYRDREIVGHDYFERNGQIEWDHHNDRGQVERHDHHHGNREVAGHDYLERNGQIEWDHHNHRGQVERHDHHDGNREVVRHEHVRRNRQIGWDQYFRRGGRDRARRL
jgi:hypothetical protein